MAVSIYRSMEVCLVMREKIETNHEACVRAVKRKHRINQNVVRFWETDQTRSTGMEACVCEFVWKRTDSFNPLGKGGYMP